MVFGRYAQLREQLIRACGANEYATAILRDGESNYVPIPISERLVQCLWFDQRLAPPLRAVDGRPVRVIFAGWWNLEAGPDFRRAVVQIGDTPERTGDIEVHLRADDWFRHQHHHDPAYNNVVLHVVLWRAGSDHAPLNSANQFVPQLVLEDQLAAPLEQLHDEIDLDAYPHNVGNHTGRCADFLAKIPDRAMASLLDDAGDERFAMKTRRFVRWIHRVGPAQAFYEGWMEALGYKSNKRGFRTLAQRVPLTEIAATEIPLAALLFGVAGFLPVTAGRDAYTKRLWRAWWKHRPDFTDRALPAETWQFHGQRPANHPHRRLGAAVALLKRHPHLMEEVLAAVENDDDPGRWFAPVRDDYWSDHFTLGGKTQRKAAELIGAARAREIVSNIVLPFAAAYARSAGKTALAQKVKECYDRLRPAPSHSVLRLATQQLFGPPPAGRQFMTTTRRQQGLMQVFQDFCINDKSACQQCQFPELVKQWSAGR